MNGLESLYQEIMVNHVKEPRRRGLGESATVESEPVEPEPVEPAEVEPGRVEPGRVEPGTVESAMVDPATVESHQLNPTCGDEVTVQIWLDGDRVRDVRWEGDGCMVSQSSASILAQQLPGLGVDEVRERIESFRASMHSRGSRPVDEELLGDAVALEGAAKFVARVKCAMLAWVAVEDALGRAEA